MGTTRMAGRMPTKNITRQPLNPNITLAWPG